MKRSILLFFLSFSIPLLAQNYEELAQEAYIFGYPLVLMDATMEEMSQEEPINQFSHFQTFPDSTFTDVVRPNVDTLYSIAWLDLSNEPLILALPDTKGRYYLMQMLDGWTDVFAAPGKRTTGTRAGQYALVGPNWTGNLPKSLKRIDAPTDMVWIIGRTQTNGVEDYPNVHMLQDNMRLIPLSQWGKDYRPKKHFKGGSKTSLSPAEVVEQMDAVTFFTTLGELMEDNPPHPQDEEMVQKLKELAPYGPEKSEALEKGMAEGRKKIHENLQAMGSEVNGWQIPKDLGNYGTDYLKRATVALTGLGANLNEDAIYPIAYVDHLKQPLDARNKYILRFKKGQVPPVNAFWSITLYNEEDVLADNSLDRYALGDRDRLNYNPEGSLDIYIQRESPGAEKETNWLPTPSEGKFSLAMRLYWPKPAVTSGKWTPPPVEKIE